MNRWLERTLKINLAAALLLAIIVVLIMWAHRPNRPPDFQPCPTLSPSRMQSLADGLKNFTAEKGNRPATLEEMVKSGHVEAKMLFSAGRENIPDINKDSGRFETCPDAVYFPALREGDPAELILACTLLLSEKDDKYLVIHNDYHCSELGRSELTEALNRTYMYIGSKINWDVVLPHSVRTR